VRTLVKFSTNATVARARALHGKRLTEADYRELAGRKSVSEAAEYLKKSTSYSAALSSVNTATVHRGYLESVIRRYSFDRYINICDFQQLRKEQFYNYLIVLSEIREILSVILHINADSSDEYITAMPAYLIGKTGINLIELAKAKNIKEMLAVLRHTRYYPVLKTIAVDENGHVDYLNCEIKLRTFYYQWLMDTIKKELPKKTAEELLTQIKTQIDLINIINAYRMKKFYGLSSAEIDKKLLPFYRKLNKKTKTELFENENGDEFLKALSKTSYGREIDFDNSENFETEVRKLRSKMARRALAFSQSAAVSVYSLVLLDELEVDNIITVIEGIRYGRSPDNILSMVIPT